MSHNLSFNLLKNSVYIIISSFFKLNYIQIFQKTCTKIYMPQEMLRNNGSTRPPNLAVV
jgi:hypothetical protein